MADFIARREPKDEDAAMSEETIQQAALRLARDLAGGVSYLSAELGMPANALDDLIQGKGHVPHSLFLRVADYIATARQRKDPPPGLPPDWKDGPIPRA